MEVTDSPAGPAPLSDSPAAEGLCNTKGRDVAGREAQLRAAFESSRAEVAAWQETRVPHGGAVSGFVAAQPPVSRIVVCWFDGTFAVPSSPGAPPADRAVVLATADAAEFDFAGPKERLEIARPSIVIASDASELARAYLGTVLRVTATAGSGEPGEPSHRLSFDNGAPLPEDSVDGGGGIIGAARNSGALPAYAYHQFQTSPSRAVVLFTRNLSGDEKAWRVLDVLELELAEGEAFHPLDCMVNGTRADDIVAVIDRPPRVEFEQARRAWRFDEATERVIEIDARDVVCQMHGDGY